MGWTVGGGSGGGTGGGGVAVGFSIHGKTDAAPPPRSSLSPSGASLLVASPRRRLSRPPASRALRDGGAERDGRGCRVGGVAAWMGRLRGSRRLRGRGGCSVGVVARSGRLRWSGRLRGSGRLRWSGGGCAGRGGCAGPGAVARVGAAARSVRLRARRCCPVDSLSEFVFVATGRRPAFFRLAMPGGWLGWSAIGAFVGVGGAAPGSSLWTLSEPDWGRSWGLGVRRSIVVDGKWVMIVRRMRLAEPGSNGLLRRTRRRAH